jgi:hypothetical protein
MDGHKEFTYGLCILTRQGAPPSFAHGPHTQCSHKVRILGKLGGSWGRIVVGGHVAYLSLNGCAHIHETHMVAQWTPVMLDSCKHCHSPFHTLHISNSQPNTTTCQFKPLYNSNQRSNTTVVQHCDLPAFMQLCAGVFFCSC